MTSSQCSLHVHTEKFHEVYFKQRGAEKADFTYSLRFLPLSLNIYTANKQTQMFKKKEKKTQLTKNLALWKQAYGKGFQYGLTQNILEMMQLLNGFA